MSFFAEVAQNQTRKVAAERAAAQSLHDQLAAVYDTHVALLRQRLELEYLTAHTKTTSSAASFHPARGGPTATKTTSGPKAAGTATARKTAAAAAAATASHEHIPTREDGTTAVKSSAEESVDSDTAVSAQRWADAVVVATQSQAWAQRLQHENVALRTRVAQAIEAATAPVSATSIAASVRRGQGDAPVSSLTVRALTRMLDLSDISTAVGLEIANHASQLRPGRVPPRRAHAAPTGPPDEDHDGRVSDVVCPPRSMPALATATLTAAATSRVSRASSAPRPTTRPMAGVASMGAPPVVIPRADPTRPSRRAASRARPRTTGETVNVLSSDHDFTRTTSARANVDAVPMLLPALLAALTSTQTDAAVASTSGTSTSTASQRAASRRATREHTTVHDSDDDGVVRVEDIMMDEPDLDDLNDDTDDDDTEEETENDHVDELQLAVRAAATGTWRSRCALLRHALAMARQEIMALDEQACNRNAAHQRQQIEWHRTLEKVRSEQVNMATEWSRRTSHATNQMAEHDEHIQRLQQDAAALRATVASQSQQVAAATAQVAEYKQQRQTAIKETKALREGELRAAKEDVARKAQLIQHMRTQLTHATETLAALEGQLKASDIQVQTLQKQVLARDVLLEHGRDRVTALEASESALQQMVQAWTEKYKEVVKDANRKENTLRELKLQMEELKADAAATLRPGSLLMGPGQVLQPVTTTSAHAAESVANSASGDAAMGPVVKAGSKTNGKDKEGDTASAGALAKLRTDVERRELQIVAIKSKLQRSEQELQSLRQQMVTAEGQQEIKWKQARAKEKAMSTELATASTRLAALQFAFKSVAAHVLRATHALTRRAHALSTNQATGVTTATATTSVALPADAQPNAAPGPTVPAVESAPVSANGSGTSTPQLQPNAALSFSDVTTNSLPSTALTSAVSSAAPSARDHPMGADVPSVPATASNVLPAATQSQTQPTWQTNKIPSARALTAAVPGDSVLHAFSTDELSDLLASAGYDVSPPTPPHPLPAAAAAAAAAAVDAAVDAALTTGTSTSTAPAAMATTTTTVTSGRCDVAGCHKWALAGGDGTKCRDHKLVDPTLSVGPTTVGVTTGTATTMSTGAVAVAGATTASTTSSMSRTALMDNEACLRLIPTDADARAIRAALDDFIAMVDTVRGADATQAVVSAFHQLLDLRVRMERQVAITEAERHTMVEEQTGRHGQPSAEQWTQVTEALARYEAYAAQAGQQLAYFQQRCLQLEATHQKH
jgi:hypothetical protein